MRIARLETGVQRSRRSTPALRPVVRGRPRAGGWPPASPHARRARGSTQALRGGLARAGPHEGLLLGAPCRPLNARPPPAAGPPQAGAQGVLRRAKVQPKPSPCSRPLLLRGMEPASQAMPAPTASPLPARSALSPDSLQVLPSSRGLLARLASSGGRPGRLAAPGRAGFVPARPRRRWCGGSPFGWPVPDAADRPRRPDQGSSLAGWRCRRSRVQAQAEWLMVRESADLPSTQGLTLPPSAQRRTRAPGARSRPAPRCRPPARPPQRRSSPGRQARPAWAASG